MATSTLTETEYYKILFPAAGVAIGIRKSIRDLPLELHSHDFHELVIVIQGTGVHFTETEEYQINAGDVFLIKPGLAHGYRVVENLGVFNVLYFKENLQWPLEDLREMPGYHAFFDLEPAMRKHHGFQSRLRLDPDSLRQAEILIRNLETQLTGQKTGYRFLALSWFMQLVFHISASYTKTEIHHSLLLLQLGNLLKHIDKNFAEPFSVNEMATIAGLSERSLNRWFQTAFGCSPGKYLLEKRVGKAAAMLNSTDLAISEISGLAGFTDSNYFARQFRRFTGQSPREYRRCLFNQQS